MQKGRFSGAIPAYNANRFAFLDVK
ncbi:protein of unknown function [Cupriavidus taiwanensis]|uniref:Uncharacterized protein n=1 Tax=Cupriavidus taiwanensis TaxID=164546 RepID=A0A7Z7J9E3_9BURK|nr:protein of unknown function [Cupriavidus taiwanensis]SOZ02963.1 hypothetical protein CBM2597_A110027 [Cupriavidus taiwanensis]SOZ06238.1 hypothetical protein CBM2595_A80923 [Cupriavidus taiwanensis]SPC18769.1 hypothetical protein CBM2594_A80208 [Cupriavidus taiwanensis]